MHAERDAVHGRVPAVALGQVLDLDHRLAPWISEDAPGYAVARRLRADRRRLGVSDAAQRCAASPRSAGSRIIATGFSRVNAPARSRLFPPLDALRPLCGDCRPRARGARPARPGPPPHGSCPPRSASTTATLLLWNRKLDSFEALTPGETHLRRLPAGRGRRPAPERGSCSRRATLLRDAGGQATACWSRSWRAAALVGHAGPGRAGGRREGAVPPTRGAARSPCWPAAPPSPSRTTSTRGS